MTPAAPAARGAADLPGAGPPAADAPSPRPEGGGDRPGGPAGADDARRPPSSGAGGRGTGPADDGLLSAADIRRLAADLGVRPTKQRGQNFVIDPNTVRRIVRAADVRPDDAVLEIGPGLGSLTLALLRAAGHVTAVEIDDTLAAALPATIAEHAADQEERFSLVHADALHITGEEVPGPPPTALVANLPYNVAVPVLLHVLERFPAIERTLVMVQAEVADRLAAPPGSRVYGVPSVKAAWYARTRRAGSIGRKVFWPAPNVDSGLVSLIRRDPPETRATRAEVFAVVDAAFAQRRKTLRSALAGWAGSPAAAEEALTAAGVSPRARGEALTVEEFARIAEHRPPAAGHAPLAGHDPVAGHGPVAGHAPAHGHDGAGGAGPEEAVAPSAPHQPPHKERR